jgi:hypothetical protein
MSTLGEIENEIILFYTSFALDESQGPASPPGLVHHRPNSF